MRVICKLQDEQPLMVAATSGTTVLGAYDDLNALSDVCHKHGIWLHCDVIICVFLFLLKAAEKFNKYKMLISRLHMDMVEAVFSSPEPKAHKVSL